MKNPFNKKAVNDEVREQMESNAAMIAEIKEENINLKNTLDWLEKNHQKGNRELVREELELPYRIGNKDRIMYPYIPPEWDDTFFTKFTSSAAEWGNITLDKLSFVEMESALKQYYFRHKDGKLDVVLVANCDTVIKSKNGLCLQLSDPYDTIITEPLTLGLDFDKLTELIGHIVIVNATVSKEDLHSFKVTRVKRTIYNTFGEI